MSSSQNQQFQKSKCITGDITRDTTIQSRRDNQNKLGNTNPPKGTIHEEIPCLQLCLPSSSLTPFMSHPRFVGFYAMNSLLAACFLHFLLFGSRLLGPFRSAHHLLYFPSQLIALRRLSCPSPASLPSALMYDEKVNRVSRDIVAFLELSYCDESTLVSLCDYIIHAGDGETVQV